jgi:EAL domain-containing protein (putative c-di-GMP-specific phosphodiesterase class I)/PAS domain-containing protein
MSPSASAGVGERTSESHVGEMRERSRSSQSRVRSGAAGASEAAALEARLAAEHAAMRDALDAMTDPFVVCTAVRAAGGAIADFRIEYANRAAGAFVGSDQASLIGLTLASSIGDALGDWLVNACREVVETGQAYAAEGRHVARPHEAEPVEDLFLDLTMSPYGDGLFFAFRDVTRHVRLSRERDELAAIVEESADGVVVTDTDHRVVYANPSFVAATGRGLPDLLGTPLHDVMGDVWGPAIITDVHRTINAGRRWVGAIDRRAGAIDRRAGVVDRRIAEGTMRHFEVSVAPGRGPSGEVSRYVGVTRDVTELREAEAELVLQAHIRAALAESLFKGPAESSLEQAAQAICDELVTLAFVDVAAIQVFLDGDDVQILAQSAPPGYPVMAGTHLPTSRAASRLERAASGPWARYADADPNDRGLRAAAVEAGLKALAYGPITHREHIVGTLVIGTFDEQFARMLVEKMPGVVSFGAASSAMLAERMYGRRLEAELRVRLGAALATRSFHPVFQPIVDLESSEVVGFEALTRFDWGQSPDLCFADAWAVGLGPELELATLKSAVDAARRLAPCAWIDLNVSPRLLSDRERLRAILQAAGRPIVLEVTEHEIIDDYGAVRDAVRALGPDIRLAVDDAGAGVANFGHIIDLRPDFVKLDISLVRRVNTDLGRQAMVVGMRHFSRSAGCRLIAEGVETAEEARTLTALGVEFAQGYFFGHPEPVERWAAADGSPPSGDSRP